MKSTKCRKGGNFNLFMGILVGILAGFACGIRWLISTDGDTWLRALTKQLMGKEAQLMTPDMATKTKEILKDEYILIALIAAGAFIVLAIIFYIANAANKKKALKRAYEEEIEPAEEAVDAYYYSDEQTAVEEAPAKTVNNGCALKNLKAKVAEKLADEKVKKVVTVAAACAVTAVVVSRVGSAVKAKRRHQFFRWLG